MSEPTHTIHLRKTAAGYSVTVEPDLAGFDFNKTVDDYKYARTYAKGIRLYRGFELVDETGEAGA